LESEKKCATHKMRQPKSQFIYYDRDLVAEEGLEPRTRGFSIKMIMDS